MEPLNRVVPWEAGIIRVADEFLLKIRRRKKKEEQKNGWNGGRKGRKKGPRKEKGDPHACFVLDTYAYENERNGLKGKKKKEKKKNTNYLYIFILAWSNTCTVYGIVVCASSLFRWKWKLRTVQLLPSLIVYLCRKGNDIEFNE